MAGRAVSRYPSGVRPFALASCLVLIAAGTQAVVPREASALTDFDPSGRGKKKPGKPPPSGGGAKPGGTRPPKPTKPDEDSGAKSGPSNDAKIARYTAIVLSQPSEPFP